jgi:hypothetical protein
LRKLLPLILGLLAGPLAGAATTYEPPPLGRLVLNELLTPAVREGVSFPLYLDKGGRYFGELIVETAPDAASAVDHARTLAFEIEFWRRDKLQRRESVQVTLAPGERHKTLFRVDSPSPVPSRVQLAMKVRSAEGAQMIAPGVDLRLQLTRKFEFRPLSPP